MLKPVSHEYSFLNGVVSHLIIVKIFKKTKFFEALPPETPPVLCPRPIYDYDYHLFPYKTQSSSTNAKKNVESGSICHCNFFKLKCLLINSNQCQHSRHLMFSNIERAYDRLPKHLNSAITKLLYCFSRGEGGGAKNGRNTKIGTIPLENYIYSERPTGNVYGNNIFSYGKILIH